MKELKFKVYIKSLGQIVKVISIDFENELVRHEAIDWNIKMNKEIPMRNISPFSDCNILQYINKKDKNNKEIYEGDIIKCEIAKKYQDTYGAVVIKNVFFNPEELRYEVIMFLPISWGGFTSIEIVGNKYKDSKYLIQ